MTEPIIVPAARVVLKPLLFAFATLAGYFVAWGLVFVMDAVVRAFFGTATGLVGWVPFAGRIITSPLLAIEHNLTSYLGGLEAHFDKQMAARWHSLASLVSQLALDTKAAAILDWQIARKVATSFGNTVVTHIAGAVHAVTKVVRAEVRTVTRTVVRVEKIVGTKADAVLVHRLGAVAGELEHVIDWTIPSLRARDKALTDSLGRLWHRLRGDAGRLAAGAAVGALIYALGKLGMGSLRCKNVGRAAKQLCGMNPSWLEALLAGALAIIGPISLVTFARVLIDAMDEITAAVQGFIQETHGVPTRSATQQGFAASGGAIAFRSASDQGFA